MLITTKDLLTLRRIVQEEQLDIQWLDDQLDDANGIFAVMDFLRDQDDRGLRNLITMIEAEQKERGL